MSAITQGTDTLTLAAELATMDAEKRAMILGYLSGMVDSALVERKKEKDSKVDGDKTT